VVRSRAGLTVVGVLWAAVAGAQSPIYTGLLTGHIGGSAGGDARSTAVTPGASVAVIDASGLGAEVDLGHAREFDDERFSESGITTLMVNVVGMLPHARWRPFVVAGVGLMRVRASLAEGQTVASKTDWGMNAGGGLHYSLSETVGIRGDVRYFRYVQRHDELPLTDSGFFDVWRTSVGLTLQWTQR
jgi:opacity protein-like surface antigen